MSWSSMQSSGEDKTVEDLHGVEYMIEQLEKAGEQDSHTMARYRLSLLLIKNYGGQDHYCLYHLSAGIAIVLCHMDKPGYETNRYRYIEGMWTLWD